MERRDAAVLSTGDTLHRRDIRHSQCKIAEITDGTSNTFLLGERHCWPDHYTDGGDGLGDDQGWMEGYDYDNNRWVQLGSPPTSGYQVPRQDTPGYQDWLSFGSAHASGFGMALCDGSVHATPLPTRSTWRRSVVSATVRTGCRPIPPKSNKTQWSRSARFGGVAGWRAAFSAAGGKLQVRRPVLHGLIVTSLR